MNNLQNAQINVPSQPIPSVPTPTNAPPFSGGDPFWIIVALAILVKAILGNGNANDKGDHLN
ncbi:MAG: hypothetical protein RLZZ490_1113 [Cyanobacteriota bacterium]|jgi:hypothetical protein